MFARLSFATLRGITYIPLDILEILSTPHIFSGIIVSNFLVVDIDYLLVVMPTQHGFLSTLICFPYALDIHAIFEAIDAHQTSLV